MLTIKGTFNEAKVFTELVDEQTINQIKGLCEQEFLADVQIRIMPDTHLGKGSAIGTTMTIGNKVVPNLVGVDIGCGMTVAKLTTPSHKIDFEKLDKVIRRNVPSGFNIRKSQHELAKKINWDKIVAPVDIARAKKSVGTLGGGNHFIEVNKGTDGAVYLVVHSGSRNLGKQIAEHYQKMAAKMTPHINRDLAYLEGQAYKDYINDMEMAQTFAYYNRKAMVDEIVKGMDWQVTEQWESIHNYSHSFRCAQGTKQ